MLSITKMFFVLELKKLIKNPKLIFSIFITPILISIFIIYGVTDIQKSGNEIKLEVWNCVDKYEEDIKYVIDKYENISYRIGKSDTIRITTGDVDMAIQVDDSVEIIYSTAVLKDQKILTYGQTIANDINMKIFHSDMYDKYIDEKIEIFENDTSTVEERIHMIISIIFVLMFMLAVMQVNNAIITLESDSISGEKEYGIFNSYRLSGASLTAIIAGKAIYVSIVATLIYIIEIVSAAIAIAIFSPDMMDLICTKINGIGLMCIVIVIIEIASIATAAFTVVCAFCDKTKHANAYGSTIMNIVTLSVTLPIVTDSEIISYIPVLNFAQVPINSMCGNNNLTAMIVSAAISIVICVIIYYVAAKVTEGGE